jgi:hypothetical protein
MGHASRRMVRDWSFEQDVEGILNCLGEIFDERISSSARN